MLGKAAKKIETPESNGRLFDEAMLAKLDLGELDAANTTPIFLKPGLDNNWIYSTHKGTRIDDIAQLDNALLILDKAYIPPNIQTLKSIPGKAPILLRHNDQLYQLKRSPELAVASAGAYMATPDFTALQNALFHLAYPWHRGRVHIAGIHTPKGQLSHLHRVDPQQLTQLTSRFRGETIVLSGTLRGNTLTIDGADIELDSLASQARRYDTQLIILDSNAFPAPGILTHILSDSRNLSTRNLLDAIAVASQNSNRAPHYTRHLHIDDQVIIQRSANSPVKQLASPADVMTETGAHLALHSVRIYRPDQTRQEELDHRLIWWLHSNISLYLIVSFFCGTLCFVTCRELLARIWRRKESVAFKWWVSYTGVRAIRLLIILLVVLPLFGLPCLIYRILYNCYRMIRWAVLAVIYPFRLIFRRLSS